MRFDNLVGLETLAASGAKMILRINMHMTFMWIFGVTEFKTYIKFELKGCSKAIMTPEVAKIQLYASL